MIAISGVSMVENNPSATWTIISAIYHVETVGGYNIYHYDILAITSAIIIYEVITSSGFNIYHILQAITPA